MLVQRQQQRRGATILVGLSLVSFVYILYNLAFPHLVGRYGVQRESLFLESTDRDVECHAGSAAAARDSRAKDVLVIMKTGATEARRKVPVHFDTTFRCIPNYVIYSDMEERINNVPVHDALANFSATIKATNQDFHFYYRQHKLRAEGQNLSELVTSTAGRDRAWNLDKWKFLPLLEKALRHSPQAKWFVFIEADTFLVWSNMLRWLDQLDPDKPLYIGGQNWLGDTKFAHGGTGYVVSRKALRMAVDGYTKERQRWDEQTATEAAGDALLAKLFNSIGIGLTETWPITQGETPFSLDYTTRHLCFPVVTYHHVSPEWVRAMWKFEQIWFSQAGKSAILRHRDVFNHVVAPQLSQAKAGWDNLSGDNEEVVVYQDGGADSCRRACQARPDCVQWHYNPASCKTGNVIKLGANETSGSGVENVSGWMLDRIAKVGSRHDACRDGDC
ncbi:hypothetical protein IWX50DRAFT_618364 [Phyllosticta citricarpa]|uniref:N-acetylgalactosaminide beta-1,3-galactosyltransferase n=1 Tax=Phyllosticta citricarpa TaxID=55181 RepID=A0ABR1LSS9_9PEZI